MNVADLIQRLQTLPPDREIKLVLEELQYDPMGGHADFNQYSSIIAIPLEEHNIAITSTTISIGQKALIKNILKANKLRNRTDEEIRK